MSANNDGDQNETDTVAMKMLLKMGYRPGSGLGKREEGRTDPIQVSLRAKNAGIGFGGEQAPAGEVETDQAGAFKIRTKRSRSAKKQLDVEGVEDVAASAPMPREDLLTARLRRAIQQTRDAIRSLELEKNIVSEQRQAIPLVAKQMEEVRSEVEEHSKNIRVLESARSIAARSRLTVPLTTFMPFANSATSEDIVLLVLSLYFRQPGCNLDVSDWELLRESVEDSVYCTAVQLFWLPAIREHLADGLQVGILCPWMRLLPDDVRRHIVGLYIAPRLSRIDCGALEPFLVYLDPVRDREVFVRLRGAIKSELGVLFAAGNYAAARDLYLHWLELFPKPLQLPMSLYTIVPCLVRQLSTIAIDPRDQDTRPLQIVLPFLQTVPEALHPHLFRESGLEHKLDDCITRWLSSPPADYGQIAAFLQSWRSILPRTMSFRPLYLSVHHILDKNG